MQDKMDKGPETFRSKAIRACKNLISMLFLPFTKLDPAADAAAANIQMGSRIGMLGNGGAASNRSLNDYGGEKSGKSSGNKSGSGGGGVAGTAPLKEILVSKEMKD
jgi:uncharacterized membrane protein